MLYISTNNHSLDYEVVYVQFFLKKGHIYTYSKPYMFMLYVHDMKLKVLSILDY